MFNPSLFFLAVNTLVILITEEKHFCWNFHQVQPNNKGSLNLFYGDGMLLFQSLRVLFVFHMLLMLLVFYLSGVLVKQGPH